MTEINHEINDAVGEIANMISGQARLRLEEMGRSLKAAIPTVITGKNHSLTHMTTYPVIAIPFSTDQGGSRLRSVLKSKAKISDKQIRELVH